MSDEQTTPPTPDAGESESVRTLQRIRETCADVEAWQVWSADGALLEAYPGELLDHIATLTAQLAAAKADGERVNWLESARHVCLFFDVDTNSHVTTIRDGVDGARVQSGATAKTIRAALDAARTGAR